MTISISTDIINKKQLLREISGLELCYENDTARSVKYATVEGIQEQIDYAFFKPLINFLNEGIGSEFITSEMAKKLYDERIEILNTLKIKEIDVDKYEFAPFFILSHEPSTVKEGTMKSTMNQLRMIKERYGKSI